MKKLFAVFSLAFFSLHVSAQIDMGVPTATGKGGASTAILRNWDCIGINPANLGWKDNCIFSIGVFNFGIAAQSDAFKSNTLRMALTHPNDTFSLADKQNYAHIFDTPNALNLQAHLNWAAASVYFPKLGGFALNVRDRTFAHVGLNKNAADIIFNGRNAACFQDTNTYHKTIGQIMDSTNIAFLHYRELNLSYGHKLFAFGAADANGEPAVQVFGGFGLKYLWGLADFEGKAENSVLSGHSSITTNYNVNYGTLQNFTPEKTSMIFNAVGSGFAFDAGLSATVNDRWRFGIAATDMGSIHWKNNQLLSGDTTMTPPDTTNKGINSWNVGSQASYIFNHHGLFNYTPGPDYTTKLPSMLRIGAGYKLDHFEAALDIAMPLSKTPFTTNQPYFALGGEYNFLGYVKISAGFAGNSTLGWSVPMGLIVGFGGVVETGVATGDILTFLDKSKNPYLSASFFVIRVNVKPLTKDTPMPTN